MFCRDGSAVPFLVHSLSSDDNVRRFLVARDWDVGLASEMLREHLRWRRRFFPVQFTSGVRLVWEQVGGTDETTRFRLLGYNSDDRPVVALNFFHGEFLDGGVTLEDCVKAFVDFLQMVLEQGEKLHGARGMEVVAVCSGGPPPGRFARRLLKVLEANYPETAHSCAIYPIPTMLRMLANAALWFVPLRTQHKTDVLSHEAQLLRFLRLDEKALPDDLRGGVDACKARFRPDTHKKHWVCLSELLEREEAEEAKPEVQLVASGPEPALPRRRSKSPGALDTLPPPGSAHGTADRARNVSATNPSWLSSFACCTAGEGARVVEESRPQSTTAAAQADIKWTTWQIFTQSWEDQMHTTESDLFIGDSSERLALPDATRSFSSFTLHFVFGLLLSVACSLCVYSLCVQGPDSGGMSAIPGKLFAALPSTFLGWIALVVCLNVSLAGIALVAFICYARYTLR